MKRLHRRVTIYRFRAIASDGEIRQSRTYTFLPAAKRQAAYWIARNCEVTLEASTELVEFKQIFGWKP